MPIHWNDVLKSIVLNICIQYTEQIFIKGAMWWNFIVSKLLIMIAIVRYYVFEK